jgi:hypothetical protein
MLENSVKKPEDANFLTGIHDRSLIQKYLLSSKTKFEFPQPFDIACFLSIFSQQILAIGLWEVRLSGLHAPLTTLIVYPSLRWLIFNRLFLHLSIWSFHYKFMTHNAPAHIEAMRLRKTLPDAQKKGDISEKSMVTF